MIASELRRCVTVVPPRAPRGSPAAIYREIDTVDVAGVVLHQ